MRVQDKDKFVFTKNVAVMLTSGIPLREAIQSQVAHAGSPFFKGILARIIQDIETGQRFSFALSRHPSVFEPFYVNVVSAGEKAGSLEQNLEYIAAQLEARAAFKKALNSALMYPAVLLIAVCGVGFVFAYFVLPTLGDLLSSFQAEPPFATKIILFISVAASDYGPL
ncbi:type II secretion system F family protein, partial [Candidatus Azambacteria bacterium]|nr:type II secretion system F family protein [Candidatus Azambacteria bacterium]